MNEPKARLIVNWDEIKKLGLADLVALRDCIASKVLEDDTSPLNNLDIETAILRRNSLAYRDILVDLKRQINAVVGFYVKVE